MRLRTGLPAPRAAFSAYGHVGTGMATALHFTYPVAVLVLVCLAFCEPLSLLDALCVALSAATNFLYLYTNQKAPAEENCKGFVIVWSQLRDLNSRPADYESAALPTELSWQNLLEKLLAERQPPVNLQDATSCRSSWHSCLPGRR